MVEALQPKLDGQVITNLLQIIEAIKTCEDLELLKEYQTEVLDYTKKHPLEGAESLVAALSVRIEDLEQKQITNAEALETLKEQNPNLQGLSVIETKRTRNDSGKDTDYIKFVDATGQVQILECRGPSMLNEFIETNPELAINGTPEEIFAYFKEHKYPALSFSNLSDDTPEKVKEELAKIKIDDPRINNVADFMVEKQMIEEYSALHHNHVTPNIAINSDGERIYTVGEAVIKFRALDGKRKMEIISGPGEYNLENAPQEVTVDSSETITSSEEASLVDENNPVLITDVRFNNLLGQLYSGDGISDEERRAMEAFVLAALSLMKSGHIEYDMQNSVDLYLEYLTEKEAAAMLPSSQETNKKLVKMGAKALERVVTDGATTGQITEIAAQTEIGDEILNAGGGVLTEVLASNELGEGVQGVLNEADDLKIIDLVDKPVGTIAGSIFNQEADTNEASDPRFNNLNDVPAEQELKRLDFSNPKLTPMEKRILSEYKAIIKTKELEQSKAQKQEEAMTLKYIKRDHTTQGAIMTIVILEITVLLGILISVLALVKK